MPAIVILKAIIVPGCLPTLYRHNGIFLVHILMSVQTAPDLFTQNGIKLYNKMEAGTKTNPTIIAIFGGTGDLTWRKLIPALYNLYLDNWLNSKFSIVCIGRQEMTQEDFIKKLATT